MGENNISFTLKAIQNPAILYEDGRLSVVSLRFVEALVASGGAVKVPRHVEVQGRCLPVFKIPVKPSL